MFVNKLKMDEIAEAVKKCMDEADLEETGLRKAAYAAHTKGEKMFSFKGKTYPVKVQGEEVSYGKEIKEASCEDEVKKHEKRLHGKDGEVSKHVDKMHKEELSHKQKKIAKLNHPKDEIDAGDLAKLRGEETEFELTEGSYADLHKKWGDTHNIEYHSHTLYPKHTVTKFDNEKDAEQHAKKTGGTVRMSVSPKEMKEETELDEADKVATSTGMKVYGSSYGDSAKARRDQLKRPVDATKGPKPSELAQMAKVKKEEFFKDRLITNYIEEEAQFEAELNEVLSKDASAGDWISDFVHSDNPKFAGKSVKKRQKMALAAYYAKKRNESVDDSYPVTTDTVAGRMPGGMSNTFKQFKVKVSAKDKEAAETKNRIPNSDPMNMTASQPHVGHGGLVSIPPAGIVRKEEVELDEATPPKNTDISDKSYLKDMGKKPTVKSDLKNFKNFLTGKKETNESLDEAASRKDFQMVADLIKTHDNHDKRKELATHHAEIFHRQNPRFDRSKFMKAANVNEGKQPETDNVPFVTNADQPPFDGPYKKIDKVTTDKSGAKHTPMSRARDLAQSAMKRVKTEMLGKAPGNNG
jgi:hypothetical protein